MARPAERVEFTGTPRFEPRRRIGEGAVGVVYQAYDREHDADVALKALRVPNPDALLSLKNEFRAVRDLYHPNLVRLGELFEYDGAWFFSMELVRGGSFIDYVRQEPSASSTSGTMPAAGRGRSGFDEGRLRPALAQLIDGLRALHAADIVHRDIKPSNVLVSHEGRVVILDFGVAADALRDQGEEGVLVGTLQYMAPEQLEHGAITKAADWYALGVVLYEALTGQVPFAENAHRLLEQKLNEEPPPPRSIVPEIPEDLAALCQGLLRIDPGLRPSADDIASRFGSKSELDGHAHKHQAAFVGRRGELLSLREAFQRTQAGRGAILLIHGESGVGKSYLVRQFLDELHQTEPRALLLSGRCYERESVPYKAFDGIIDNLSRFLRGLPETEVWDLLPHNTSLLVRAFPVLGTVEGIARRSSYLHEVLNPQELRARVFASLRELLSNVARSRPLIIAIDDLQWTDADSLAMLSELTRPPDEPPFLLVGTVRIASETRGASVEALARLPGDVKNLSLSRLSAEDAKALALQLLAEGGAESTLEIASSVALEANGHPLFIDEIVRQRKTGNMGEIVRLDDALWSRITRLSPAARRLLELVAVAGMPVVQETAASAAAIDFSQLFDLVTQLRAEALLRVSGSGRADEVETYHDRIRESVLVRLDSETKAKWHGRLAVALEHEESADAEAIATHWQGSGDVERAARYYERAAGDAVSALAFDRAARLFTQALEVAPHEPSEARKLKQQLADALTNAGRIAAAADLRLELAETADAEEALELRRRAAEQLLCSGHFQRGLALVRDVLKTLRVYYPESRAALLLALVVVRVVLLVRGIRFRERSSAQVPTRTRLRIDATWSASSGFSMSDNVRGAYFQTLNLLWAMSAGDPHRVARGLGFEVCFRSAGGPKTHVQTCRLLAEEQALVERVATPEARALASAAEGYTNYMVAKWPEAKTALARAEELFRDQCVGATFNLNSSRTMLYRSLAYLGELNELGTRLPPVVREAERHNDSYALTNYQCGPLALLSLSRGELVETEELIAQASGRLAKGVFLVQHYFTAMAACQLDLYRGNAAAAYERVVSIWPALQRSLLLRVQPIAIVAWEQRARTALALARTDPARREELLQVAERDAALLDKVGLGWPSASALGIRAATAALNGDRKRAATLFGEAAEQFQAAHMQVMAASARGIQGTLENDAERVQSADAVLRGQGVVDPARFSAVLLTEV